MPGMSGPDLQQELTRRRRRIPIVFITGHADLSVGPRLLAARRGCVPGQALQRDGPLGCRQGRASWVRFWLRDGDMISPGEALSGSTAPVIACDTPVVFVVDDDISVRESLELLILSRRAGSPRRSRRRSSSSNVRPATVRVAWFSM